VSSSASISGVADRARELALDDLAGARPVTCEAGAGLSSYFVIVTVTGDEAVSALSGGEVMLMMVLFVLLGEVDGNFRWTAEPERGLPIVTLEGLALPLVLILDELPESDALPSSEVSGTLEGLGCID
jgi:hypothetical protein